MFTDIPTVLEHFRQGRFIVLVDDEDRENEGDLVLAAQHATPELINQMLRLAAGYLCLSLTPADCDRLELHDQSPVNSSVRGTPFTVSIDAHPRHNVSTGVSAQDRAKTIQLAIDPDSTPEDFVRPGHINPLRAREGGVLVRTGQTEGSVDLARLAGLKPAALIIEITNEDGSMARRPDLEALCAKHHWPMCSVEQLIKYRLQRERLISRLDPAQGTPIHTAQGTFNLIAYESVVDPLPHLALTLGDVGKLDQTGNPAPQESPTLVRMHRRDLLGDIFLHTPQSKPASTGQHLRSAMQRIQQEGRGAIVYMRPEGTGEDFNQTLTAIRRAQHTNINTPELRSTTGLGAQAIPMHQRDFGIGSQILRDLGINKIRLLTNAPKELPGLDAFALEIVEHVDLHC